MRLLPFKRKSAAGAEPRKQGLARAREDAMEQMRQRLDEPEPVAAPAVVDESSTPEQAADPLAGLAETVADPLAGLVAESAAASGPGAEEGAAKAADPFAVDAEDSDLLDIFRDAQNETEEGTLASEVEQISMADLLGDIAGIREGLGIKARPAPAPEPELVVATVEPEAVAEPEIEAMAQAETAVAAGPAPVAEVDAVAPPETDEAPDARADDPPAPPELPAEDVSAATEPDPAVVQAAPIEADETAMQAPPAASEPTLQLEAAEDDPPALLAPSPRGQGGRYLLHVLFFGLALAAAAGAGLRTAHNSGAFAASVPPQAKPAILAYLQAPVVLPEPEPTVDARALERSHGPGRIAPSPSPTRAPTPTPAPTVDPRQYGFQTGRAAWVVYKVRSGDDLAAIGKTFGICPDHIIWSNPGRAIDDALTAGTDLILPGYPGLVYKVQEGDTIAAIAARYSTDPGMITAYPGNKLRGDADLKPGKSILLPQGIPPEAFMQSAEARRAYTVPSEYGYIWPFYGPITTYYGEPRPNYTHNAIDIGGLYQFGTPVLAVAAGTVEKVEQGDEGYSSEGYGNHVIIKHNDGSRSLYAHLTTTYVEEGDKVKQAQPLGGLGCTGHSTGTHLHFELYRDGGAVDPLAYLPSR